LLDLAELEETEGERRDCGGDHDERSGDAELQRAAEAAAETGRIDRLLVARLAAAIALLQKAISRDRG
jgi:hypothetical protein